MAAAGEYFELLVHEGLRSEVVGGWITPPPYKTKGNGSTSPYISGQLGAHHPGVLAILIVALATAHPLKPQALVERNGRLVAHPNLQEHRDHVVGLTQREQHLEHPTRHSATLNIGVHCHIENVQLIEHAPERQKAHHAIALGGHPDARPLQGELPLKTLALPGVGVRSTLHLHDRIEVPGARPPHAHPLAHTLIAGLAPALAAHTPVI